MPTANSNGGSLSVRKAGSGTKSRRRRDTRPVSGRKLRHKAATSYIKACAKDCIMSMSLKKHICAATAFSTTQLGSGQFVSAVLTTQGTAATNRIAM